MTANSYRASPELATAAEVLKDARLVAAFGMRSGKLKEDSALLQAIAESEQAVAHGTDPHRVQVEALAPLVGPMKAALAQIEPMTLEALRRRDPYEPARLLFWKGTTSAQKAHNLTVLILVFTAFLILLSLGALLVWVDTATRVAAVYAQNNPARYQDALRDLVVMTEGFADGTSTGATTALELAAIGDRMNEANAIQRAMGANAVQAQRLDKSFMRFDMLGDAIFGIRTAETPPLTLPLWVGLVAEAWRAATGAVRGAAGLFWPPPQDAKSPVEAKCDDPGRRTAADQAAKGSEGADITAIRSFSGMIRLYLRSVRMIECSTGLEAQRLSLGPEALPWADTDLNDRIAAKLRVANAILLPASLGLLGAMLFHFRVYMDPLRPDVPPIRVVLRICLGGFAGMAVVFLMSSDSSLLAESTPGPGRILLPFVLGFSIDTFFKFLDRLVFAVNRWVDGIGAPPGTPPGGAAGSG